MKKIILIFAIAIIVSGCELKKLDRDKFIDENKTDKEVVDSDNEVAGTDSGNTVDDSDIGNTGDCSGNFPKRHKDLCWSDLALIKMNWSDANLYCEVWGGRLPNIQELRSLIKECPENEYPKPDGQNPWCEIEDLGNLGGDVCDGCTSDTIGEYSVFGEAYYFWSSSAFVFHPFYVWYVDFTDGKVYYTHHTNNIYAYCVR